MEKDRALAEALGMHPDGLPTGATQSGSGAASVANFPCMHAKGPNDLIGRLLQWICTLAKGMSSCTVTNATCVCPELCFLAKPRTIVLCACSSSGYPQALFAAVVVSAFSSAAKNAGMLSAIE